MLIISTAGFLAFPPEPQTEFTTTDKTKEQKQEIYINQLQIENEQLRCENEKLKLLKLQGKTNGKEIDVSKKTGTNRASGK